MTITWTDNSGNEDNFRIEVSEDGGTWSYVTDVSANTTSYTYSAATATDTHRFRVRAENQVDVSSWSYTTTKSTDIGSVAKTVVDGDQIDLSWDDVDGENGYDILRAEATGSARADYDVVANVAADTTSYSDTGLEDGEKYFYRIDAVYSSANSLSGEIYDTTPLPSPDGMTVTDSGTEDEITVSWNLNDDSTDGGVEVLRSTDGTTGSVVATLASDAESYTDTGLLDGEEYHYTVRRNTDHASADSSQVSSVTILPAPTTLTVDTTRDTEADISWTDNHDYGDTRVDYKRSSATSWTTFSTLSRNTEAETLTGLLNGEEYDARAVAETEHTETVDA